MSGRVAVPEYGRRRMLSCVTRCITESDWLRPAADGLAVGHGGRPPSEVRASLWDTAAATWCMACCIPSYWLRPAGDGPCGTRQRRPGAPPALLETPPRVSIASRVRIFSWSSSAATWCTPCPTAPSSSSTSSNPRCDNGGKGQGEGGRERKRTSARASEGGREAGRQEGRKEEEERV